MKDSGEPDSFGLSSPSGRDDQLGSDLGPAAVHAGAGVLHVGQQNRIGSADAQPLCFLGLSLPQRQLEFHYIHPDLLFYQ